MKVIYVACLIWYHVFGVPFAFHLVALQGDFIFCFNMYTLPRARRRLKAVGFTCWLRIGNLSPCFQDFVQMGSKAAKIILHPLQHPGWQHAALRSNLLFVESSDLPNISASVIRWLRGRATSFWPTSFKYKGGNRIAQNMASTYDFNSCKTFSFTVLGQVTW